MNWHSFWTGFRRGLDVRTWPATFLLLWRWFKRLQPIYWLRTHTYNRYHMLDVRSEHDYYKWGWCDRDHIMLLANFKILCEFVEKEISVNIVEWNPDGDEPWAVDTRHTKAEIDALYRWWTVERPAARVLSERLAASYFANCTVPDDEGLTWLKGNPLSDEVWRAYRVLDERIEETEDENLIRLMKIRGYLWT